MEKRGVRADEGVKNFADGTWYRVLSDWQPGLYLKSFLPIMGWKFPPFSMKKSFVAATLLASVLLVSC